MNTAASDPHADSALPGVAHRIGDLSHLLGNFPPSITQLVLRLGVAVPFFLSGLTKWDGWFHLSDGAVYLFTQEFQLHLFGNLYAYPMPKIVAALSGTGEIVLPILLVFGLATRFAALGILCMTLIIQLTVPDGWANFHLPWAAMALAVMTYGPGRLSIDHFIARRQ